MGEDSNNLPLEDKIEDEIKHLMTEVSSFSNPKYVLPKMVTVLMHLIEEYKKKIKEIEEKLGSGNEGIKIEKYMDIAKIFVKGGDIKGAEKVMEKARDIIGGKKGLFPYLNTKLKFLGISIPLGTILILGGIGSGVWYLANNTDVFRITQKLNNYEAAMQTNTKKAQEYYKNIDDFIKKYSGEFDTQKKLIDDITAHQKSLDEKLSSYSDQILDLKSSIDKQSSDFKKDSELYRDSLEKQVSDIKNEITSSKESYEQLKADNESYKGFMNETKKSNEEATNKIKELEKKSIESDKKYEKLYKKINSKK